MRFGPVPIGDAVDAILAHSLRLSDRVLKKGRKITREDVKALDAEGHASVIVAEFGAGDLAEDEAAGRLAHAVAPDPVSQGLTLAAPFTGRANIYAATSGVLRVDTESVHALNAVDEAITLATLPDFARVTARQMLGTVKIIPYGVSEAKVEAVERLLSERRVLEVKSVQAKSARLLLTRTPGMKDSVVAKGGAAVESRLSALGISDVRTRVVPHETGALSAALGAANEDLILILMGSATSDRADVGPMAVVEAGGAITRFGMPVDPGNLLFLGEIGQRPVIGLPGCARSPKLNGADWVLERIACGLMVSHDDIAAMGVGGLLKEIPSRPEPRGGGAIAPQRPKVAAIVLAAGSSSRMRGSDKLLEPVNGSALIRHVTDMLGRSGVDLVICVLRTNDAARMAALEGCNAQIVLNPRAEQGMGTSIAAAIATLDADVDAALIVLADMPGLSADHVDRLLAAFDPAENRSIVRAMTPEGRAGHPVLFGRRFFEPLAALQGDAGARQILAEHSEFIAEVILSGDAAVIDLDTPEAWQAWRDSSH